MKLQDKHMSMIQTLEHDYGNLGNVPDDHPQLLVIQAHVKKGDGARNCRARQTWTDEEHDYLKDNHNQYTYAELGEQMGRPRDSVRLKAKSLGLNKKRVGLWSNEEKQFLRDNYSAHTARMLAKKLKRTRQATQRMIRELGLKKNNV
ncbi:hypothetical protein [Salmonella enterica]|uniref:hypothetical protein n=1 Tax=Salmonella enterica TaxID=28901 RepID=UPI000C227984|nr:hypothetical protein [Salmonella enterica]PJH64517.1 hypothetical protein CVR98_24205 [Salmonella enterica subsp. enterica serovar Enteritidis]